MSEEEHSMDPVSSQDLPIGRFHRAECVPWSNYDSVEGEMVTIHYSYVEAILLVEDGRAYAMIKQGEYALDPAENGATRLDPADRGNYNFSGCWRIGDGAIDALLEIEDAHRYNSPWVGIGSLPRAFRLRAGRLEADRLDGNVDYGDDAWQESRPVSYRRLDGDPAPGSRPIDPELLEREFSRLEERLARETAENERENQRIAAERAAAWQRSSTGPQSVTDQQPATEPDWPPHVELACGACAVVLTAVHAWEAIARHGESPWATLAWSALWLVGFLFGAFMLAALLQDLLKAIRRDRVRGLVISAILVGCSATWIAWDLEVWRSFA